jgi:hypothetical protein
MNGSTHSVGSRKQQSSKAHTDPQNEDGRCWIVTRHGSESDSSVSGLLREVSFAPVIALEDEMRLFSSGRTTTASWSQFQAVGAFRTTWCFHHVSWWMYNATEYVQRIEVILLSSEMEMALHNRSSFLSIQIHPDYSKGQMHVQSHTWLSKPTHRSSTRTTLWPEGMIGD